MLFIRKNRRFFKITSTLLVCLFLLTTIPASAENTSKPAHIMAQPYHSGEDSEITACLIALERALEETETPSELDGILGAIKPGLEERGCEIARSGEIITVRLPDSTLITYSTAGEPIEKLIYRGSPSGPVEGVPSQLADGGSSTLAALTANGTEHLDEVGQINNIILQTRELCHLLGLGCRSGSVELLRRLALVGIYGEIYTDNHHWWVETKLFVLDPRPDRSNDIRRNLADGDGVVIISKNSREADAYLGLKDEDLTAEVQLYMNDKRKNAKWLTYLSSTASKEGLPVPSYIQRELTIINKTKTGTDTDAPSKRLTPYQQRVIDGKVEKPNPILKGHEAEARAILEGVVTGDDPEEAIARLAEHLEERNQQVAEAMIRDTLRQAAGPLDMAMEEKPKPEDSIPPSLTRRMHARHLLSIMNLLTPNNMTGCELIRVIKHGGLTVHRMRLPEAIDKDKMPTEGPPLLKYLLLNPKIYDVTEIDLLYNNKGFLIAVFPVVPMRIRNNKNYSERPKYLDLSPYYFDIPAIGDSEALQKWKVFVDEMKKDRELIEEYQAKKKTAAEIAVGLFVTPYFSVTIDKKGNTTAAIILRVSDQLAAFYPENIPAKQSKGKHQAIFVGSPTVYNPVDYNKRASGFRKLLYSKASISKGDVTCDVCSGTGIIAWILSKLTEEKVYAIELHPLGAVDARENAKRIGFEIDAVQGDNIVDATGKPRFDVYFDWVIADGPQYVHVAPGKSTGASPAYRDVPELTVGNVQAEARDPVTFEDLHEEDYNGERFLQTFSRNLPQVGRRAILWNAPCYVGTEENKIDMTKNTIENNLPPDSNLTVATEDIGMGDLAYFIVSSVGSDPELPPIRPEKNRPEELKQSHENTKRTESAL